MTTSLRRRSLVVLTVLAVAGSCADPRDDAHRAETDEQLAAPERLRVIVDYSPTVSDVGALLYLASHPTVELMAVTLAGTGESDCVSGTRLTRTILDLSGHAEVPVGCGRDTPIVGHRDWPVEWRNEAHALADLAASPSPDRPAVDAEALLATTLASSASPITIVAVGPLTNVGSVLGARPELVAHVERVVVMGGAVDVPGNVEASPSAEWNLYIDPEAVRLTLASGASVLFIALDATRHVPWNERLLARLGSLDTAAARFEHDMVSTRSLEGVYLWDELAAVATIEPSIVTTEERRIVIDDAGAIVLDDAGTVVQVAVDAVSSAATTEFVRVLSGGVLPPIEPLDDTEAESLELEVRFRQVETHCAAMQQQSLLRGGPCVWLAGPALSTDGLRPVSWCLGLG